MNTPLRTICYKKCMKCKWLHGRYQLRSNSLSVPVDMLSDNYIIDIMNCTILLLQAKAFRRCFLYFLIRVSCIAHFCKVTYFIARWNVTAVGTMF